MRTASELVFDHVGLGTSAVPYQRGWDLQRQVHDQRVRGAIGDTCLLLEHEPVYTAGKRTGALDRPVGDPGAPVIEVDRGGKITWHGPGQLTGYPVISLPDPVDVVAYVRTLEEALIGVCADFGVRAGQVEGRSGVWVDGGGSGPERKIASIGIRVARGVTMHGFALNCDCDLAWFGRIVPCGIPDAVMTSLSAEAGRTVAVPDVLGPVQRRLAAALGASGWREAGNGRPLTPIA